MRGNGALYWDELETELTYSPEELRLARGRVRRGPFFGWIGNFHLYSTIGAFSSQQQMGPSDVSLAGSEADDLQKMLGTSYPASRGLF